MNSNMQFKMKGFLMMIAFFAFGLSAMAQDEAVKNGIKMYQYNKFKSAQTILAPLAEKDALANYYLGLSYLEVGNIPLASATFAKFPEDIANISGTARVAYAQKDVAKGNAITKALAGKAKKKDWMQQKYAADAITYTEGGDYNQAVAWYKEVLSKNEKGDNADVYIGIGDAMRHVPGGGGEAMTSYEMVTDKDKSNSLAFSRIGDLWYEARNYQSALDNYARAKDADNTNPLPYKALANAYSRSGKYALALENITEYLSHSDKTPEDELEYDRAMYQAQNYCEAAKLAEKLMQTQKDPAKVIELTGILGFSQANCGDSTVAVKNIRKYFAMQDAKKILPGAYLEFGKLFLKMDMLDSAGFYYTKGIAGDTSGDKSDVYREVADAFKSKKEYCKSAEWYNKLVKANPNASATDYVWRVIMFYYCGDMTTAMTTANEFEAKHGAQQPPAAYWQARVAAAIDSEATTGLAAPHFTKWLEKVGWSSYDKKKEVKGAYEYLLYYYYNAKDKENLTMIKEKLLGIDPTNSSVKEIEQLEKQNGGAAKKRPTGNQ